MKRIDIYYGGEHYSIGGRRYEDLREEIEAGMIAGPYWLEVNDGEGQMRAAHLLLTPGVRSWRSFRSPTRIPGHRRTASPPRTERRRTSADRATVPMLPLSRALPACSPGAPGARTRLGPASRITRRGAIPRRAAGWPSVGKAGRHDRRGRPGPSSRGVLPPCAPPRPRRDAPSSVGTTNTSTWKTWPMSRACTALSAHPRELRDAVGDACDAAGGGGRRPRCARAGRSDRDGGAPSCASRPTRCRAEHEEGRGAVEPPGGPMPPTPSTPTIDATAEVQSALRHVGIRVQHLVVQLRRQLRLGVAVEERADHDDAHHPDHGTSRARWSAPARYTVPIEGCSALTRPLIASYARLPPTASSATPATRRSTPITRCRPNGKARVGGRRMKISATRKEICGMQGEHVLDPGGLHRWRPRRRPGR